MVSFHHKSTADFATAAIRQMILTGELPPGSRVDQNEMAKLLDISRHPVRQAIERLAERGFVESRPHKSVVVSVLSVADMEKLYAVRILLEDMAIRQSWPHFDDGFVAASRKLLGAMDRANAYDDLDDYMIHNYEFHMGFYRSCGNPHLIRVIDGLFQLSERYQRTALAMERRSAQAPREHQAMIDAILQKDLDRLLQACAEHNTGTMQAVRSVLGEGNTATD